MPETIRSDCDVAEKSPEMTRGAGHLERRILVYMSEEGGWTAGSLTRHMGYSNVRSEAQLIRRDLVRMKALGWVTEVDDSKPACWVRTAAGTEALEEINHGQ